MYRFVVLMILSMCLLQCSKTPKGETDTENTVDAQDSVDSDVKSDLSSHGETDSDSDGDTHVDSDDDTDTGTDTNTNTGTFSDSDTASDSSSQGDTAGDSDSDTESDSETHSDIESGSGTESGSDTVADTDSNSDSESESGADSDSSSQGDTETDNSVIPTTCSAASRQVTSVGCEFYVADLGDSALTYAVVVSNPQHSTPANVRIEDMRDSGGALRTLPGMDIVLDASELHVFELTCESGCPETTSHVYGTGLLPGSAFRVVSDVPILAYQWNTYGDDMYSCDASLLIPAANLGTSYIGAAWPYNIDAYLTVVATKDNTDITFTPTSEIRSGDSVPALSPGIESDPITLNAFDVIQIQPSEDNADLTGTVINASAPVAVFGGNKCAIVPGEMCCCDHLEEQLLPLNAWGEDAILARHAPRFGFDEVADQPVWRIVAGSDGMTVAFDPPVEEVGSSYHFTQAGEVLQFQSPGDHHVTGELDTPTIDGTTEAPFMAYQLMTGQCYLDNNQCHNVWGDPMMLLAPPAGQYLDRYVFNTDDKHDFRFEHVIVIRPQGATVEIECIGILNDDAFIQVGTSNFEVGRFTLEEDDIHVAGCVDGTQRLFSDQPVGLMVVGYDSGNSYGYLGGVGVRHINPVIVVK